MNDDIRDIWRITTAFTQGVADAGIA